MIKDLRSRVVESIVIASIVSVLVFFANHFIIKYLVAGFVAILASISIWEYDQFVKAKNARPILSALIFLTIFQIVSYFFAAQYEAVRSMPVVVFFLGLLMLIAFHFRKFDGAIVDLAVSFFGFIYIAVPMGMILGILYSSVYGFHEDGRWWLAYLLVVTKMTDIGAYIGGNLLGKRKLAPHISPQKTIEGSIFGFICALLASFLFYLISIDPTNQFQLGSYEWILLGLIIGVTSQFGDLTESLLKRDANIKNSNALPGLGGALDALDSLLVNAPIIYFYLQYIKK